MKIIIILISFMLVFFSFSARAQLQTLVVSPTCTNSAVITLSSNSYAVIKSFNADYGGNLLINMHGVNFTFDLTTDNLNNYTFTGPATIQLINSYGPAFTTVDIEPGPFPPGKTLTVEEKSGKVQVTMQMSTDLVN